MGGKITNAQALAATAQACLKDIAKTEGHDFVPSEEELTELTSHLEPSEDPYKNRCLNTPKESGRGIADLFRRK